MTKKDFSPYLNANLEEIMKVILRCGYSGEDLFKLVTEENCQRLYGCSRKIFIEIWQTHCNESYLMTRIFNDVGGSIAKRFAYELRSELMFEKEKEEIRESTQ